MHQGQPSPSPRKTLQDPAKTALGKLNQLIGLNHRGCCLLGGDGNGSVGHDGPCVVGYGSKD